MNPSVVVNSILMQIEWFTDTYGKRPNIVTLGTKVFHTLNVSQNSDNTLFGKTIFGIPIRVDMFEQDVVSVGLEYRIDSIIKEVCKHERTDA